MTIRSQFSAGCLVLLVLGCSLFCFAAVADEQAVGGDIGYFEITSVPSGGAVIFDGTYKGTTPVTFPVYVTASPSHTIKITKSGYNDWEEAYQGNPAPGETTAINAQLVYIPVTPTPTTVGGGKGYYSISSVPSGGAVYFDNQYKGTTPVTVEVSSTGTPGHKVSISLSGYDTWTTSLAGNPAEGQTIPVTAYLTPVPTTVGGGKGYYSISSVPSGGTVYFDNQYKGTTPVTVEVSSTGTPGHKVSISLSGYDTWTTSLAGNPAEGQTIPVTAYLTPVQNYGSIIVYSNPSGATAVVDGRASQITPATFSNLYPGSHTVYVSKSGYSSVSRTVTVSAGSTTQVSVTLSQIPQDTGSIYMVTTPQGANAYVDGVYYGITPALATGLTVGNHEVKLSRAGFKEWVGTVNVVSGSTTTVTQTLHTGTVTPTPTKTPETGTVAVSSSPAGAQVYIDNAYEGITPVTIPSIAAGNHTILIQMAGYADWQISEDVKSGETTQVSATLSPHPTPTEGGIPAVLVVIGILAALAVAVRRE